MRPCSCMRPSFLLLISSMTSFFPTNHLPVFSSSALFSLQQKRKDRQISPKCVITFPSSHYVLKGVALQCAFSAVEKSAESLFFFFFSLWGFWRKASDQRDIFRTLVGKWHLVEYSQHLSRWQTGGRMEDRIKDCEIKPLQPGDLCQRVLVCQQHYMQKYQRKYRAVRVRAWANICKQLHTVCVYTDCVYSWVCASLFFFIFLHARRFFASFSICIGAGSKNRPGAPR